MTAAVETTSDHPGALVVFGLDEKRKPHASRFSDSEADLAQKAAALMNMHVLRLENDEQRALAAKLPRGRVFGSGRAFVPFVKAGLYESLAAMAGVSTRVGSAGAESAPAGSPSPPEGHANGQGEGSTNAAPDGAKFPTDRAAINIGSVVLAPFAPMQGWWEAVVLKISGDLLTLEWRDYPDEGRFVRRRHKLALLPTGKAA